MLSQSIALDVENLYPDFENEEYDSDLINYLNNEKEALAQANNFQDLISKKDEKYGVSISSRPKTFDVGVFGRHSTKQKSIPGAPGLDGENGQDGKNGNNGTEGLKFSKIEKTGAPGEIGEDGEDGKDGKNGEAGTKGQDGKDSLSV
jgi:hypothetical protein